MFYSIKVGNDNANTDTQFTDLRIYNFLRSVGAQVLRQAQHKLSKARSPIYLRFY